MPGEGVVLELSRTLTGFFAEALVGRGRLVPDALGVVVLLDDLGVALALLGVFFGVALERGVAFFFAAGLAFWGVTSSTSLLAFSFSESSSSYSDSSTSL